MARTTGSPITGEPKVRALALISNYVRTFSFKLTSTTPHLDCRLQCPAFVSQIALCMFQTHSFIYIPLSSATQRSVMPNHETLLASRHIATFMCTFPAFTCILHFTLTKPRYTHTVSHNVEDACTVQLQYTYVHIYFVYICAYLYIAHPPLTAHTPLNIGSHINICRVITCIVLYVAMDTSNTYRLH